MNSEYRAKFLSPAQYLYKAGAWTRVKENMPDQVSLWLPSSPTAWRWAAQCRLSRLHGPSWQLSVWSPFYTLDTDDYYQSNFYHQLSDSFLQFSLHYWFVSHDIQTSSLSTEGRCPINDVHGRKAADSWCHCCMKERVGAAWAQCVRGVPWLRGGTGDLNRPEESAVVSQYRELGLQGQIAAHLNS